MTLFWLQFFRILLWIKTFFQSIVWCISLRVSTHAFCYYRPWLKSTTWLFHLEVSQWDCHIPYDCNISCPMGRLKRTNNNSSTMKIRLTSVTNSQAVSHKSWVARCSLSTLGFIHNKLHNFHGFNHSHSQSSHHKDLSLPAPLSNTLSCQWIT